MTTEYIPGLSGSQFCLFLVIQKRVILKYEKLFENEKFNSNHPIIESLQSYFMWAISSYQVNFSLKDPIHLLSKISSFEGYMIFQALPIYLRFLFRNLI